MANIVSNHRAVFLTQAPTLIAQQNSKRIGLFAQNQEVSANIFLRSGGDGHVRSYIKLKPDGFDEDNLPSEQELWAFSDGVGAILTLVEKYLVRS